MQCAQFRKQPAKRCKHTNDAKPKAHKQNAATETIRNNRHNNQQANTTQNQETKRERKATAKRSKKTQNQKITAREAMLQIPQNTVEVYQDTRGTQPEQSLAC